MLLAPATNPRSTCYAPTQRTSPAAKKRNRYTNSDVWEKVNRHYPQLTAAVRIQCAWRQHEAREAVRREWDQQDVLRGVDSRTRRRWAWLEKFRAWFDVGGSSSSSSPGGSRSSSPKGRGGGRGRSSNGGNAGRKKARAENVLSLIHI